MSRATAVRGFLRLAASTSAIAVTSVFCDGCALEQSSISLCSVSGGMFLISQQLQRPGVTVSAFMCSRLCFHVFPSLLHVRLSHKTANGFISHLQRIRWTPLG